MKTKFAMSLLACGIGLALVLSAADILPLNEDSLHAPRLVLALCGLVFFCGGLAIHAASSPRLNAVLASTILASFAAIGSWVALYSDSEDISGGLWFFSQEQNATLGRIFFSAGVLMTVGILWIALKEVFKSRDDKRDHRDGS